ncbi:hypothetical protein ACFLV3_02070 [Chloroflexota bacterium]
MLPAVVQRGVLRDWLPFYLNSDGIGHYCYEYLRDFTSLHEEIDKLVQEGNLEIEEKEYSLPHGRTYEVISAPYIDADGIVCQLAIFTDIKPSKKA